MVRKLDEQELWNSWIKNRDPHAGNLLIKKYQPLVSYHVQRIGSGLPKNVSRDDLTSLGMMGLFDALNKFDINRDLQFDTYASFRVRGAIIDGLRKEDWLSRSARDKAKKMESVIERLEQKLMRHVTPEELAEHMNIPVEEVYQTVQEHFFSNILSLNETLNDQDDNDRNTYMIRDENARTPEQEAIHKELIEELADNIKKLSEREQLVLSLFYSEEMTLTEIGEVLNLSTSRISQIHSKALLKLRKLLSKEE
ncbi:FliA/WhiG family RNA polymerase sigma factor [Ureibacillus sp. FSL K6-8385]|uniref:FliA/WhiG family RNA polymerase sigma factor n=1 Tax=Ureibacillus terrenus TaxID=118246 RepID=A0A540V4H1_9BACL|nr:FliA/WhiG family RNA polymerase sigma factor [Ureibacillus terrenus]MED3660424.1 FliA/WhiG family RNA polymerase sigma factor [Ureibacillus terrenus]MED3762579.1 FliA/WhiG family RNA polymerase sigma factor [Ureibacillus terrenus]TQE91642.1 FliA/WhiG family RNA polymerase sigma factor [Ureibacillus terrenus]